MILTFYEFIQFRYSDEVVQRRRIEKNYNDKETDFKKYFSKTL